MDSGGFAPNVLAARDKSRPRLRPRGAPGRSCIPTGGRTRFECTIGRGAIEVTLDGAADSLELRPIERARGATFDRFGIFNLQAGGHDVEIYLDDLSFTIGK